MGLTADWIFDEVPASGARHGGLAQAEVFNKDVDTFVREVLQNARDQKLPYSPTVKVRFRLDELKGADLADFLQFMTWDQLEPHLNGTANAGYITISPRVTETLDLLRSEGVLRLLRIDDAGT